LEFSICYDKIRLIGDKLNLILEHFIDAEEKRIKEEMQRSIDERYFKKNRIYFGKSTE